MGRRISSVNVTKFRSFLRIWSQLLKKSLMENFIFCPVINIWQHLKYASNYKLTQQHCVKVSKYGVFSGPYCPVFSLKTGKYGPKKTPHLDTFHTVQRINNSSCSVMTVHAKVNTAQKMTFSIKDFFSKWDQIGSFLRIWSHFLKKSLVENFIFYAVKDKNIRGKFKCHLPQPASGITRSSSKLFTEFCWYCCYFIVFRVGTVLIALYLRAW